MKTITLALVAAFIGSATMSAPSFAMSRHQGARAEHGQVVSNSDFDPFHQTAFNANG